jgi:high-affinity nickel-transport protein
MTKFAWTVAGLYGFIALLHAVGWGAYLHYSALHPALVGLGLAAYLLGLRHAFDADHIAAIDDTVRLMLQHGRRPVAVGFWFSLGHATIVFAMAASTFLVADALARHIPELRSAGAIIGGTVSGVFLWLVGILNLVVLAGIFRTWREARRTSHGHDHVDELLAQRGLLNRFFGGWARRTLRHSWQMYPLGLLFGLGFDTATEVSLLALTAGATAGSLPAPAILALPVLFAAGMCAMDTTDGILMVKAYSWAFVNPLRKVFYNLTITSLSVAVALAVGTIQLMQVAIDVLNLRGTFYEYVDAIELAEAGYWIVVVFLGAWAISVLAWRLRRREGVPA